MGKEKIRYYCTAGNGMEPFLIDEVKRKLKAEEVFQVPGKVLFVSSSSVKAVTELKAAERLFLLLKYDTPTRLPAKADGAKATSLLQSRLLGDPQMWTAALQKWSWLQEKLVDSEKDIERKETIGKKRKRTDEEVDTKSTTLEVRDENDGKLLLRSNQDVEAQNTGEFADSKDDCDGGTALKAQQKSSEKPACVPVTFRISCKCTGALSRCLSSQEASRVIGVGVRRLLGWKSDLKNPQLEINVNLSDDQWILGIPLTRVPLANRSYIKNTGLRSTVAWAMVSLAQIKPGFCVVDPMCGVGTILMEAAQEHKDVCFVGADIDHGQLQKASQNVAFAELGKQIHLIKASCMAVPLPSASVDAVICDLPFGRKFGTKLDMAANLSLILTEMERVLCPGGCLVLLLSPQLSFHLKKHLSTGAAEKQRDPQTEKQTSQRTSQLNSRACAEAGMKSSSTEEPEIELQSAATSTLSSLEHQATIRVSLGTIDGLIHKYVKTASVVAV